MDGVSFELFRFSYDDFYKMSDGNRLSVKIDSAKDNRDNVVHYTYMISLQDSTGYTLNLYPTRCSLLINGKATSCFIKPDLPKIHELMSKITTEGRSINIKQLNDMLATQLNLLPK